MLYNALVISFFRGKEGIAGAYEEHEIRYYVGQGTSSQRKLDIGFFCR